MPAARLRGRKKDAFQPAQAGFLHFLAQGFSPGNTLCKRSIPSFTWEEALHEFFLHLQATRAKKTQRYYKVQIGGLSCWAVDQQIPFSGFGKRHMDRYLVSRAEAGKAPW